jgi:hypothetical protein
MPAFPKREFNWSLKAVGHAGQWRFAVRGTVKTCKKIGNRPAGSTDPKSSCLNSLMIELFTLCLAIAAWPA